MTLEDEPAGSNSKRLHQSRGMNGKSPQLP
jgi:hypothetical protein